MTGVRDRTIEPGFVAGLVIVGLIALCWLLAAVARIGMRHRNSLQGFSVLAFVLVLFIGSLTDTQILPFPTAMGLILFTGIAGALDAQEA